MNYPRKLIILDNMNTMKIVFEAVLDIKFKAGTCLFANQYLCIILNDLIEYFIVNGEQDYLLKYLNGFKETVFDDPHILENFQYRIKEFDAGDLDDAYYPINRLENGNFQYDYKKHSTGRLTREPPRYYAFVFTALRSALLCARTGEDWTDLRFCLEDDLISYLQLVYDVNVETGFYTPGGLKVLASLKQLVNEVDRKLEYHQDQFKNWEKNEVETNIRKMLLPYKDDEIDDKIINHYLLWWERLQHDPIGGI
ncbi:hypothetical protein PsAD2_02598 [Pseudovibrio axinellae]|uniref:Uncharacterized protein n=1 Tax=Pseudovibrio axinellae TaxID=989403 RepID=A0A165Y3U1_9HYPH|nr:hypothetical protein [Pseudovibrio axinellae]KZL18414.1 hypothetical protein PsAD2_02598 [Pseudovibrio axinellae]SER82620.1 hypothetical protein SAMN05421798_1307 [Pseudovibrio axinellae]